MTTAAAPTLTTAPTVVRALLEGEIVVDIRPASDPVPTVGDRVWLATAEADPELKPAYRLTRDRAGRAVDNLSVPGWAELVASGRATLDPERIAALGGKTVLDLEARAGEEVVVLTLRAHRLARPLSVADAGRADPGGPASVPALSRVAFEAKAQGLADALK